LKIRKKIKKITPDGFSIAWAWPVTNS